MLLDLQFDPHTMDSLYKYGSIVYAKADPTQKMIVRRVEQQTYYCRMLADLGHAEIGYLVHELEAEKHQNSYH